MLCKTALSGDEPETCPICLDDFENGDRLRVLPCDHSKSFGFSWTAISHLPSLLAYHASCIDPWLLKNRRVCPICKRKVLPKQPGTANSDSDTDETTTGAAAGPSGVPSTPERTPLLSHDERSVTVRD